MKNNEITKAVIGGAFFAVPYIALSIPVLPSLLIGVSAYAAGELVFKKEDKSTLRKSNPSLYKILENAKKENKHILEMIPKIDDESIRKDLKEINDTINKIIKTLEKNPKKEKQIKNFFEYYLPVTIKLVDRFDEIEDQNISSSNSKKFYESTSNTLSEINRVFKKFLNNLYESDMTDANVEMKVLNSMLKADGLDKDDLIVKDDEDE